MIFSSTTEYALRGLSELAARGGGRVLLNDLIAGTGLPREFMAKIFQRLVKAGVLVSVKGHGGGFALSRAGHLITLMQVIEVIDGPEICHRCVVGLEQCDEKAPCALHDLYKPIRQRLNDHLHTTTLADLAASLRAKPAWMMMRRGKALSGAVPSTDHAPRDLPIEGKVAGAPATDTMPDKEEQ